MERTDLASYAVLSEQSLGRRHPEELRDDRPAFRRDRDRIIHSAAFRRLEYKTQVFVNHEGDYYRTRLTHSLEVAQIARSIAAFLRLNEDLVEALSLSHDLGHTPFGHTGEETLNRLMKDHGGFDHNVQSLRVVEELEERYPGFDGLNLTWETREGIIKHAPRYENSPLLAEPQYFRGLHPPLEAQIVDVADEIAYNNHDIDDGLKAGYITLEQLRGVAIWRETFERVGRMWPGLDERRHIYQTISSLIGLLVHDVVAHTLEMLAAHRVATLEDIRQAPQRLVGFSPEIDERGRELKNFLRTNLYRHYLVERMRFKATFFVERIFACYMESPALLPATCARGVEKFGYERAVCDYIAAMTDRYALEEYRRLFEPFERVQNGVL